MRVACAKCLSRGVQCNVTGEGRRHSCDHCRSLRIKCVGLVLASNRTEEARTDVVGDISMVVTPAGMGGGERPAKRQRVEENGDIKDIKELIKILIHRVSRNTKIQEDMVAEMREWREEWKRRRPAEGGPKTQVEGNPRELIVISDDDEESKDEDRRGKEEEDEEEDEETMQMKTLSFLYSKGA